MDQGEAVAFALWNLEDRGPMMIHPGDKVYGGMIVGEHNRDNDLEVNVLKGKKSPTCASGSMKPSPDAAADDDAGKIARLYRDDELVEVTPKNIRLRKFHPTRTSQALRQVDGGRLTPQFQSPHLHALRAWALLPLGGEGKWRFPTLPSERSPSRSDGR